MDDHSKETAPPEEEREVEKSPSQRFIKYDTEVGRGSFKTVYKALDTVNAQPVAWLELQPHKLTKEDRSRFKVRPFRVANYKWWNKGQFLAVILACVKYMAYPENFKFHVVRLLLALLETYLENFLLSNTPLF